MAQKLPLKLLLAGLLTLGGIFLTFGGAHAQTAPDYSLTKNTGEDTAYFEYIGNPFVYSGLLYFESPTTTPTDIDWLSAECSTATIPVYATSGDWYYFDNTGSCSNQYTFNFNNVANICSAGGCDNAGWIDLGESLNLFISIPSSTTSTAPTSTPPVVLPSGCVAPSSSLDISGDIYYAVCSALSYVFVPSPSEKTALQSDFGGRWTDISSRVPFGYLTLSINALNTLSTTTPTSTDIIPVSTIETIDFFGYIKTGIGYILILIFIMFLYYFGRNIDL